MKPGPKPRYTTAINLYLAPDQLSELDRVARGLGIKRQSAIRAAIGQWLDKARLLKREK